LEAWTKQVAEPDKGTFWTLISRREVTPLFHIRDALQVEDGIGVLEFTVLREQDGIPNALTTAYLAPWARELTEEADFQDGRTLFNALSDAGIKPFRVHQSMGAQLADPELAGHLDIDINTPVLTILRTNADKQGRTITFDQVFVRTDRFRYQVDFIRDVG
jgi:GntR family transcriptional regulator